MTACNHWQSLALDFAFGSGDWQVVAVWCAAVHSGFPFAEKPGLPSTLAPPAGRTPGLVTRKISPPQWV
jgi:hypothetical protein